MTENNGNKAHDLCGATNRNGEPCQLKAGWGTDHLGVGRCKFHGGASTGPKDATGNKNARKHGAYEKVLRDQLDDNEKELFDGVSDDYDLRNELRILRFKLARMLNPVERQAVIGTQAGAEVVTLEVDEATKSRVIAELCGEIRKLVKDMQAIGEDDGSLDQLLEFTAAIRKKHTESEVE